LLAAGAAILAVIFSRGKPAQGVTNTETPTPRPILLDFSALAERARQFGIEQQQIASRRIDIQAEIARLTGIARGPELSISDIEIGVGALSRSVDRFFQAGGTTLQALQSGMFESERGLLELDLQKQQAISQISILTTELKGL